MVEKNTAQCEKSEKDEDSNNTESDSTESTFHEQNLYIASFPLIASFALLNYLSHVLITLFRCILQHILKLKSFVRRPLESRRCIDVQTDIEMPKPTGNMENQLVKQKAHHRKAFEHISMALKIDEENEGNRTSFIELLFIAKRN